MITKYSIDLRQFNNGESDKITFPTFDQCLMYGIHKLKGAIREGTCVVQAILIEDGHGRNIVASPTEEELGMEEEIQEIPNAKLHTKYTTHNIKIQLYHDDDNDCKWICL